MASVKTKATKQIARNKKARKAAAKGGGSALTSPAGRKAAAGTVKLKAVSLAEQARALAEQAREQARDAGLDERANELAERAAELAERIRDSEALGKAQAKSSELAEKARDKIKDSPLEEAATELAERLRTSEAAEQAKVTAQQAKTTAQRMSDQQLGRLGGWLSQGKAAEKLRVQPAKRRLPAWLALLLGAGVGYLIGMLTAPKRGEELRSELAQRGSELKDDLSVTAQRVQQDTADMAAPAAQKPIADEVRTRLGEDPRTAELPKLNVNVAEGTVFVRGSLPAGFDESAIRDVIASVPGVEDVDLQLSAS
ncbi:MAG TPA: YtxH domain-containing protein [Egibacteraceae bacterium]|nr:YtxH domain-containing protein [Egibacteraceae bacterium]